jgi:hypothetical protein
MVPVDTMSNNVGSCEHGNDPSSLIKGREFLN